MDTIRQNKIARLVQKELSEIFRLRQRDFFSNQLITVTAVRVSADISLANIYISIFPTKDLEADISTIRSRKKSIRYWLGKKIGKQLRAVPDLAFYVDDSLDYAERIDNLLN